MWQFAVTVGLVVLSGYGSLTAATLEKLTVDEMSAQATLIVRGRISGCAGEAKGSVIYTRCLVSVTEVWKGQTGSSASFVVPGGRANGLIQKFSGVPQFASGGEHVLFLWAGPSGIHQIIGLSQGKFDVQQTLGGATARRAASTERMLGRAGDVVQDEAVQMSVAELRRLVAKATGATR